MAQKILLLAVTLIALPGRANAYDDRGYYPYSGPVQNYGYARRYDTDHEVSRLRRELRNQRLVENRQRRQQDQELILLRQQALSNHQLSARQACYYRSTGGFELCADLFDEQTEEFVACDALVVRRNPSCNELPLSGVTNKDHDD